MQFCSIARRGRTWLLAALALALPAAPSLAGEAPASATPVTTVTLDRRGLNVGASDGAFSIHIGGRIHADGSWHVGDPGAGQGATDGTEIRRGRIDMRGTVGDEWGWFSEFDFADNDVAIKDLWFAYAGTDGLRRVAGHQKQPYSLAVEMSSNDIAFTERGIDNDLIIPFIDRAIGVRVDAWGEHWFTAAGFYGESIEPNKSGRDEGYGTAGRAVFSPIHDEQHVVHVGFRGAWRATPENDRMIQIRDETSHFSNLFVLDTDDIMNVSSVTLYGPEMGLTLGPVTFLGEYNRAHVNRSGRDLDFQSGHASVSWAITGESLASAYRIDAGEYKRLSPDNPFSLRDGGCGAFELGLRYAYLDVTDEDVRGGEEQALTSSLNWYANDNLRLMFNYTDIVDTDRARGLPSGSAGYEAEGMSVFTVRGQVTF